MNRHQPQNLLSPSPTHQQACTSFRTSLTHQWADTSPQDYSPTACHGRTQPTQQQASNSLGTIWESALPTSRPTQALGHPGPHSQLCQEQAPPTRSPTPALGHVCSTAGTQDPALPTSGLALTQGSGLTHWWVDTNPGIS